MAERPRHIGEEEVRALEDTLGVPAVPAGAFDQGRPGRYFRGHAEVRQLVIKDPSDAVTSNGPLCVHCGRLFQAYANRTRKVQRVRTPFGVRDFRPET